MKIYNSNEEIMADVVNGILKIDDDIKITFDKCDVEANIICGDIDCWNITCWNIVCWDIKCRDINCWNIYCWDIKCRDINCWNIVCKNITCRNIIYYAVCYAYNNISCKTIEGKRKNCKHFALDGTIKIKRDKKI